MLHPVSVALPNTALSESEVLIFFVAIIFGLFTCIMACDQAKYGTAYTIQTVLFGSVAGIKYY